jgi:PAS domain S-box-containing protein
VRESEAISRASIIEQMTRRLDRKTDRVVVWAQVAQLVAAVALVVICSAPHALGSVVLAVVLAVVPSAVFAWRPRSPMTRHIVAGVQAVWSLLLISISGGRFEAHLHVFASLAILSLYCDWTVIVVAALCMGIVVGDTSAHPIDHLGWMVLAVAILALGCRRNARDLDDAATREATLQQTALTIQHKVENRTRALRLGAERFRALVENTEAIPFEFDAIARRILYMAPQASRMFDCTEQDLQGVGFFPSLLHVDDAPRMSNAMQEFIDGRRAPSEPIDYRLITRAGRLIHARTFLSSREGNRIRGVTLDITRQTILEAELREAQKLESVGRLAAGVAHEINTPIQFVGDILTFAREAIASLFTVIETQGLALREPSVELAARCQQAIADADLSFLKDELPISIDRALEGARRVAVIVRSMKAFSHPEETKMADHDLRHALETTLAIACNEYKSVAELELDLEPVPPVRCCIGDINRAILNVVVNAAHAIAEVVGGTATRGTLTVSLRRDETHAIISIGDTGAGIPESVRGHIFEQFFTTKPVGKGTGQGLALAHAVICEEHGGSLTFDTSPGGTTFHLRIPIRPVVALAA